MTESSVFFVVAMLLTLLNLLWIGISTELGEFNQSLWNRGTESIIIEHIFTLYSIVEIVLQIMSMKHRSKCIFSPWFRLDAACTVAIVLEVLVAPHVPAAAGSLLAYQLLRLTRLAWLLKLTRARRAVGTILNGMASGMRSAADVWILIAVLLCTCGVLLTATSHRSEHLRERYFGSVGHTILSLLSHGVAMDGLSELFDDLRAHHAIFEASVFAALVFLTYFGLLNMLVGVFCNVAIETRLHDKDIEEIAYLERHLEGVVKCYMDDNGDRQINGDTFQLIMQNADVLETLRACGTDVDGLLMLTEVLFPTEDSAITYQDFFSVIVRLRKGKPVSMSEVIGLQEFMKAKMDQLDESIRDGMQLESREASRVGSVVDADRVRRRVTRLPAEVRPEDRMSVMIPVRESANSSKSPQSPSLLKPQSQADKIRKNWISNLGDSRQRSF
ncbi:unnamed protein product [Prorocentrum cordatum]|uniref:Ion transport domain-containing protein n=1 Tax=Prorocentrum cordatum TaxID=2364126 RepID=A0ABN9WBN0_9DINO|nr:unnamed protein product [Polarella glacialis]